nr:hypothetical protein [Tanacetum cinerariifolium]
MLKTGDYDLWSMRMKQYLTHTDYALWEVIINGDSHVPELPAVGTVAPPKTEAHKLARKNELKAKSTLLLAISDEHILKFHSIKDAKSIWEAIKIRFQKLISQLELNGELISQEDANMNMDDLYNNLKVYEAEIKGQSSSGSNSHNVAFMSSGNTSSINESVTTAHDIPAAGLKERPSASSYADDRTGRNLNFNGKEPVGFDKTKVECYNCHRRGHFARECHALRNQGNRSADSERRVVPVETPVQSCSNECLQSFKNLQKQYDQQKEILNRANLEILGYQYGLESLEERIRVHQKNKTIFEESIAFLKYDMQVRDISIKDLKNQLEETMKEKDDLKEKLTKFEESSKNLTKLINSQMSANDKTGLGYDNQLSENEMPKCEIFEIASDSSVSEIDEDNNQVDKVDGNYVDCKIKNSATRLCSHPMPPKFILIVIFSPKKKQVRLLICFKRFMLRYPLTPPQKLLFAPRPQLLPSPLFVASAAVPGHHQVAAGMFRTFDSSSVSCCSKNVQLCLEVFQKYCELCRVICHTKDAQLYLDVFQKYSECCGRSSRLGCNPTIKGVGRQRNINSNRRCRSLRDNIKNKKARKFVEVVTIGPQSAPPKKPDEKKPEEKKPPEKNPK